MKTDIVLITHGLNIGGAEILVADLASFVKPNYSVAIVVLDRDGPLRTELEKQEIDLKVLNRKPGWHLSNFVNFFKALKRLKPKIIHAHQYTPFMYSVIYKILFNQKCKLIFTEHGRHYPDYVSLKRKILNQIFIRYTDRVTAVCEFAKKALINNEKIKTKISVIYNGIKNNNEKVSDLRNEFQIAKDEIIIGYAGSLRLVKNPELLLKAFQLVSQEYSKAILVYLGDGDLRNSLGDLTNKLDLKNKVIFAGNRLPAAGYIAQFDIFVQPSLSEAHSLALLEAMANSIPVIVTDVGGASESIANLQNGLLCKTNDKVALAQAILSLIKDRQLRATLAAAAMETYKKRFTSEIMNLQYKRLYEELLS